MEFSDVVSVYTLQVKASEIIASKIQIFKRQQELHPNLLVLFLYRIRGRLRSISHPAGSISHSHKVAFAVDSSWYPPILFGHRREDSLT